MIIDLLSHGNLTIFSIQTLDETRLSMTISAQLYV